MPTRLTLRPSIAERVTRRSSGQQGPAPSWPSAGRRAPRAAASVAGVSTVRVRFAPSPTGFFHVGSAKAALYNWIDSDQPVVSLRLGEQDEGSGYLSKYQTATGGIHYMLKRNVRVMGEAGWDFERESMRLVLGTMLAF